MMNNLLDRLRGHKWPPGVRRTGVTPEGRIAFEVDPAITYPHYLDQLSGVFKEYEGGMTQYHLEVARRCLTEDLHNMIENAPMYMHILRRPKWRLKEFPPGYGAEKGSQNFMMYYRQIRPVKPVGVRRVH